MTNDALKIGGKELANRFFLGTGKFKSKTEMMRAIKESGIEVVTVAMRRVDSERHQENILEYVPENVVLMLKQNGFDPVFTDWRHIPNQPS